jgi:hypothetical protein
MCSMHERKVLLQLVEKRVNCTSGTITCEVGATRSLVNVLGTKSHIVAMHV